jgi:hypothetical protein
MDRKEFVKFWARYVKEHNDKEWSRQQKVLIDSQIKSVEEFYSKNPELMKRILNLLKKP